MSSPKAASTTPPPAKSTKTTSIFRDVVDLVGCALGIYACYIVYGILQEKIYKTEYGEGEKWSSSLFLVFFQCFINGASAFVILLFTRPPADKTPKLQYSKIAFSYIGAMFMSNASLAFVSYPTQALAKSCKLIPVMLMRIVINGKRYTLREYLNVLLITAGIAVFMLLKSSKKAGKETSLVGLGMLFCSLALDGYTGPTQENMIKEFKPTTHQLMLWLNAFAVMLVAIGLFVTGEMFDALSFIERNPAILQDFFVFSLLSAMGQNIILITLFRFDSLVLTTVTTTRKFFTILASVVWYGHVLNGWQWFGVGLVFAGLTLDAYGKYEKKQRVKQATLQVASKTS